ncbi:MAG TPA: hypothetical protein GX518_04670 [Firmicutes bacterium]|nr:hypothetical protein [Bacillota bacterium]
MAAFLDKYRFALLLGVFLAVGAGYFFLWGGEEEGLPGETAPEAIPQVEEPAVFTVGADSHLIYQVTYSLCGHREVLRERTPEDELGLTLDDLRTIYRDWNVELKGSDVVLTSAIEGLCDNCREKIFVGIHEGRVAVYYGEPGGKAWLKEVTEIPVDNLPPRERADLEAGIPVKDEGELPHILEGLMN